MKKLILTVSRETIDKFNDSDETMRISYLVEYTDGMTALFSIDTDENGKHCCMVEWQRKHEGRILERSEKYPALDNTVFYCYGGSEKPTHELRVVEGMRSGQVMVAEEIVLEKSTVEKYNSFDPKTQKLSDVFGCEGNAFCVGKVFYDDGIYAKLYVSHDLYDKRKHCEVRWYNKGLLDMSERSENLEDHYFGYRVASGNYVYRLDVKSAVFTVGELAVDGEIVRKYNDFNPKTQTLQEAFGIDKQYVTVDSMRMFDGVKATLCIFADKCKKWCEVAWRNEKDGLYETAKSYDILGEFRGLYVGSPDGRKYLLKTREPIEKKQTVEIRRTDVQNFNFMMQHDINLNYYRSYKKNSDSVIATAKFDNGFSIVMRVYIGTEIVWCKGELRNDKDETVHETSMLNSVTGEIVFTHDGIRYVAVFNEKTKKEPSRKTVLKREIKSCEDDISYRDYSIIKAQEEIKRRQDSIMTHQAFKEASKKKLDEYKAELAELEK